jgi:hypothetical protein
MKNYLLPCSFYPFQQNVVRYQGAATWPHPVSFRFRASIQDKALSFAD